jgi:hypothetical protein
MPAGLALDCTGSLEMMTAVEDGWSPVDERAYGRMLEALVEAAEIEAPAGTDASYF